MTRSFEDDRLRKALRFVHRNAGLGCVIALACGASVFAIAAAFPLQEPGAVQDTAVSERADDQMRAQRSAAWSIFTDLVTSSAGRDAAAMLSSWHYIEELFERSSAMHGATDLQTSEPQAVIFTLFNESAYRHILDQRLNTSAELERLRASGSADADVPGNRTIPALPDGAVILLTTWWPIAGDGVTAVPVWDPRSNPPLTRGNSYMTWQRVVAVDAIGERVPPVGTSVEFAGKSFSGARSVGIDAFQRVVLDPPRADRLMQEPLSRKAALIALGRPLQAGDSLALVALHVTAKRAGEWTWMTLWWHDQPADGPFAEDRPEQLPTPWRNYLLDVAMDPETATAADRPDICFNPWLEARFPDSGSGGGTESNCIACHRRASYPAVSFLPVTRGAPDLENDPAYSSGRLRTDQLWSLARRNASVALKRGVAAEGTHATE